MKVSRTLRAAILRWRCGEPVPVDILVALEAEGYNLARLERKYAQ